MCEERLIFLHLKYILMKRLILITILLWSQSLLKAQCTAPTNIYHYSNGSILSPVYTVTWNTQVGVDSFIVYYQFWHSSTSSWGPPLLYNGTGYSNTNSATFNNLGAGNFVLISISPNCPIPAYSYYVMELPCPTVQPFLLSIPSIHSIGIGWNLPPSGGVGFYAEHRKLGDTTWNSAGIFPSNIYGPNYTFNNLLANTWYEFRVVLQCGETINSPTNFTISPILTAQTAACNTPQIDTIVNVQCSSAQVNFTLTNLSPINYRISYWAIYDSLNTYTTILANGSNGYNQYIMSPLFPSTMYKVRIRAMCTPNDSSVYNEKIFTTLPATIPCLSTQPYGSNPTSNGTGFTINWAHASGASYYELQYRKSSDPPNAWIPYPAFTNSVNINGLLPGTAYTFRLRVHCINCNGVSPWSTGTYGTLCSPPISSSVPSNSIQCNSVLIKWNASLLASNYYLHYKKTADAIWTLASSNIIDSLYLLSGLETGKSYQYKVGCNCIGGSSTDFFTASSGSFSTKCPPPTSLMAISSNTSVIINWVPSCGITNYKIEYKGSFGGFWTTLEHNFLGSSYTLSGPGIPQNQPYDFKVVSKCDQGGGSQSEAIITGVGVECLPPDNINHIITGNQQATVDWDAIPGANQYRLEYRNADASGTAGSWNTIYVNGANCMLNNLLYLTNYDVRIKTKCFDGNWGDDYSPYYSFKTPCPGINGLQVIPSATSAVVKWNQVNGVYGYKIQYGLQNTSGQVSTWVSSNNNSANDTTETINSLNPGSNYVVRIQTKCSNSTSDTSQYVSTSFSTFNLCSPPILSMDSFTTQRISLSWIPLNGTNVQNHRIRYKVVGSSTWDSTGLIASNHFDIQPLFPGTNYIFQIKALCGSNPTTNYSSNYSFSTASCNNAVGSSLGQAIEFLPLSNVWQTDTRVNSLYACFTNNYSGSNNQSSPDMWYKFILTSDDTVEISHCNSIHNNTYLHLLNQAGSQISLNNNFGPLCPFLTKASIKQWLSAGIYYVVSQCNGSDTGSITTAIRRLTSPTTNLQLKLFIEGYYQGSGVLSNVLYNQGVFANPGLICDTIEVQLRHVNPPYAIFLSRKEVVSTNGTVQLTNVGGFGQSYYIIIKHRNAIETWSSNPVQLSNATFYNFTDDANKAFGLNQHEVESGVWAFYSGDINHDENIDLSDFSLLELDINNFEFGYKGTDMNGDGSVDLQDVPLLELNSNLFIFSNHP
jgi:hypothetical protein